MISAFLYVLGIFIGKKYTELDVNVAATFCIVESIIEMVLLIKYAQGTL